MRVFLVDSCLDSGPEEFPEGQILWRGGTKARTLNIFPTTPKPPLAYLYFYPLLKDAGYEVSYISLRRLIADGTLSLERFYESWEQLVGNLGTGVYAFTTNAQYYPTVINLSARCKAVSKDNVVVHGGPQASALGRRSVALFPSVDYVVCGEGEYRFPDLLRRIAGNRFPDDLDGIVYREGSTVRERPAGNGRVELNALPLPDYSIATPGDYTEETGWQHLLVDTSRGCPYSCKFCTSARAPFAAKSVERIVSEVRHAAGTFPALGQITFVSNCLAPDPSDLQRFCKEYVRSGLDVPWGCFARADRLDAPTLRRMKEAGCVVIHYGIESGSPSIQNIIHKRLALDEALETVRETLACGLCATANFIFGFPEETPETLNQTLDLMLRLKLAGARLYPTVLTPHSGTDYLVEYRHALQFNPYRRAEIHFKEDYELVAAHPEVFSYFYYITPGNIPIREFESLYLLLLDGLIPTVAALVMETGSRFGGDYLGMHRAFCQFLAEAAVEQNAIESRDDLAAQYRRFAEALSGDHTRLSAE